MKYPYFSTDRLERVDCPFCKSSYYKEDIEDHKNRCGCNPNLTNTLELAKGKIFSQPHPRSGSVDYFFVTDVGCRESPFSGIAFHIPPKGKEHSFRLWPMNEYAGKDLEPRRWTRCSDEQARKAIEDLRDHINRISGIALGYIIDREGGDELDKVVPLTEDGDD